MLMAEPKRSARHSAVQHLAWAVWLNHDPATCWMVTLAAYFDASGHQAGNSPIVIAALIAPEKKWLRFERDWKNMLTGSGIPYLHMKDFAHSRTPYEFLKGDKKKRDQIIAAVCRAIKPINKIIAYHVPPSAFKEANARYMLEPFWEGAYTLAATACAQSVRRWTRENYSGQPVKYFIESGDQGQARSIELIKQVGVQLIPLPKQDADTGDWFAPFQAADFVAYELAKEIAEQDAPARSRPTRWPVVEIARTLPYELREMKMEQIVGLADKYPMAFPRRGSSP